MRAAIKIKKVFLLTLMAFSFNANANNFENVRECINVIGEKIIIYHNEESISFYDEDHNKLASHRHATFFEKGLVTDAFVNVNGVYSRGVMIFYERNGFMFSDVTVHNAATNKTVASSKFICK